MDATSARSVGFIIHLRQAWRSSPFRSHPSAQAAAVCHVVLLCPHQHFRNRRAAGRYMSTTPAVLSITLSTSAIGLPRGSTVHTHMYMQLCNCRPKILDLNLNNVMWFTCPFSFRSHMLRTSCSRIWTRNLLQGSKTTLVALFEMDLPSCLL